MVRIHPDPPRDVGTGASDVAAGSERGCSSVGRAPALQAGGRRFDPVQLHQFSISRASATSGGGEAAEPTLDCSSIDCVQRLASAFGAQTLRAAVFFNNSEGKGSLGLMRVCGRWVELYLACRLKRRWRVAQTHRNGVLGEGRDGRVG